MRLNGISEPLRYQGLYVLDFGEWTATGYTAEEVAMLMEHEAYQGARVYRIHRARPDGTMELRGVSVTALKLESGMAFLRQSREAALADFETLRAWASHTAPPTRCYMHVADRGASTESNRFVLYLIYPAEREDDFAQWLTDALFVGGDTVEGGPSVVTSYYQTQAEILAREQLWPISTVPSRSREELLASVRQAARA